MLHLIMVLKYHLREWVVLSGVCAYMVTYYGVHYTVHILRYCIESCAVPMLNRLSIILAYAK
jgi:hypothetical protein